MHVFLQSGVIPNVAKPMTITPFTVPDTSMVSLIAHDMDGNVVKNIFKKIAIPGRHSVAFANDDEGNSLMGTHLYRCEMIATVDEVEKFRGETFLTLYTAIDFDQRPVLGITDDQGQISFGKRCEFPYLYNPGPQMSFNENGEPKGAFEFIEKVEITLFHPGLGLHLDKEVIIGETTVGNKFSLEYSIGPGIPNPFN